MLQHRLIRRGFQVEVAVTGREALQRLAKQFFDLVLLDGALCDMPGLDVLKTLREGHTAIELPVIMLTVKDDTEDIVEALQFGANDYLTQPIDFPVAVARIRTQLSLRRVTRQLEEANARLQRYSYLDGLTGIANRRHFDEFLAEAWKRATQTHGSVGLVLIDVDHFKAFNDAFGHAAGDEALRQVAKALAGSVHRSEDLVARYGGEEFAVVLPGVTPEGARVVAERLRAAVEALAVHGNRSALTVSAGVACTVPTGHASVSVLAGAADRALYRAKDGGRNRVCSG
jgi:diguanylate cyclase (GGDEF)-like protein